MGRLRRERENMEILRRERGNRESGGEGENMERKRRRERGGEREDMERWME